MAHCHLANMYMDYVLSKQITEVLEFRNAGIVMVFADSEDGSQSSVFQIQEMSERFNVVISVEKAKKHTGIKA